MHSSVWTKLNGKENLNKRQKLRPKTTKTLHFKAADGLLKEKIAPGHFAKQNFLQTFQKLLHAARDRSLIIRKTSTKLD